MSLPDDPVLSNEPAPGAANPPYAPSPGLVSFQDWQPGGARLEWERWKLREDPRRSGKLTLLGVVILLVGAVLVVSLPITAAVALGLALVATLSPYLLPRRFEVGEEGVLLRQGFYTTRREWSELENYQKITQGYLLQTRLKEGLKSARPNRLFPDSGQLFLPFPLESEKLPILEATLLRHIP
jgi:hypothetical protein